MKCGLAQLDKVESTQERSERIEKKCICVTMLPKPCHCSHSICDSQRNFAFVLRFRCKRTRKSLAPSVSSSLLWLRRPGKQFEPIWQLFRRNILSVSRIVLRRSKQVKTHAFACCDAFRASGLIVLWPYLYRFLLSSLLRMCSDARKLALILWAVDDCASLVIHFLLSLWSFPLLGG